jgi:hypothetical protein
LGDACAAELLGAASAIDNPDALIVAPADRQLYERTLAALRERLGKEGLEAAIRVGRAVGA